jgi:signal transduction histidine kinase
MVGAKLETRLPFKTRMKETIEQQLISAKQCLGCMHEGFVVTSAEGVICESSLTAERILEAPSMSLKGRQILEICPIETYRELIRQTDLTGRVLNKSLIVLLGEGKRKIVNISLQKVGDGEEKRYLHVFQDCADLRTMEERLVQAERLATIGRFASQIAHEIRNPLSSISLNMELLEDELSESSEEARNLIRTVMKELDRLNDIVGEYLQFSRFPKPNLKRGYADDVISELVQNFKAPVSITIESSLTAPRTELWLDERLLRQAIDNLVRNGVEAIAGSGTIRIETDRIDRFFVIRVKDTGAGIPAETQARLFEPFYTTKPHGTGLGLATAQQIVFEHNGHLVAESQPGKGATFSIFLPL